MIELIGNKVFLDDNYEIREYDTKNGIVRALISNECVQSLLYTDKTKRHKLGLDYFNYYNIPIYLKPDGIDYLMLGGGAISYPHYYLNKYKDKKIDVVEINEKCIDVAKQYFYLDELLEENKGRLNIIIDDAIKYIKNCKKRYDYILIDLFNGREPINEIYEEENILYLKNVLKRDGIIIINYIISNNNIEYKKYLNNLIKITNNYKIIIDNKHFNIAANFGNVIIILSNNEINIPNIYEYNDISDLIS